MTQIKLCILQLLFYVQVWYCFIVDGVEDNEEERDEEGGGEDKGARGGRGRKNVSSWGRKYLLFFDCSVLINAFLVKNTYYVEMYHNYVISFLF